MILAPRFVAAVSWLIAIALVVAGVDAALHANAWGLLGCAFFVWLLVKPELIAWRRRRP